MTLPPLPAALPPLALPPLALPLFVLLALLVSLPLWLPRAVIRLRERLFVAINGDGGLEFPRPGFGAAATRALYEHAGARLRSTQRGVGLSDIFWFLLMPGADLHQEHTESGSRLHTQVAAATQALLAVPAAELDELVARAMARWLRSHAATAAARATKTTTKWRVARLRELLFPLVARFWWDLCFGAADTEANEAGVAASVAALAASGADVIDALKALKLRNMRVRDAATTVLERALAERPSSRAAVAYATHAPGLSANERALALQGVVFHTGTVQLTDALTHLLLGLAQTEGAWARVAREAAAQEVASASASSSSAALPDEPGAFLGRAMQEAFRCWPLFGIAHRITDRDIDVAPDAVAKATAAPSACPAMMRIPAGTVVCFNYPAFHSAGFVRPASFEPDRWLTLRPADCAGYIPFGVRANRPCPAQRLSLLVVPAFARALTCALELRSWCTHSRSLPGRGLCVVEWREGAWAPAAQPPPASASAPVDDAAAAASATTGAETGDGLRARGSGSSSSPMPAPASLLKPAPLPASRKRRLAERPALLWALRVGLVARELAEDVVISLFQLVIGTALVIAARRAAPAYKYHAQNICPRGGQVSAALK